MGVARAVGVEGFIPEEFCDDPETYAKGWNAGFESRVAQEIADDPAESREWLDGVKARERVLLLERLASDSPNGEFAAWLRQHITDEVALAGLEKQPLDLTPLTQAREEFVLRSRDSGGATQHTYIVAADLLGTAIGQIEQQIGEGGPGR